VSESDHKRREIACRANQNISSDIGIRRLAGRNLPGVPRTGDQRWSPVSPSPAVEARIPQQVPPLRRVTLASPTAPTAAPANDNRRGSGGNRRRDYPPGCPRQKLLIPVRSAEFSTTDSCGAPSPHGLSRASATRPRPLTALVKIEVRFAPSRREEIWLHAQFTLVQIRKIIL
jgi:hypothetical protein